MLGAEDFIFELCGNFSCSFVLAKALGVILFKIPSDELFGEIDSFVIALAFFLFNSSNLPFNSLTSFSKSSTDFLSSEFSLDELTFSLSFFNLFSNLSISSSRSLIFSFWLSLNLSLSLSSLFSPSILSFNS